MLSYCRYLFVWLLIPLGWTLWGGFRASTRNPLNPRMIVLPAAPPVVRWVSRILWPGAACPASRNRGAFACEPGS